MLVTCGGLGELETHVVQSLTASLGGGASAGHQSMATVCRMTRALLFPPQFKTLREWFHYAFANSEIDGTYRRLPNITLASFEFERRVGKL